VTAARPLTSTDRIVLVPAATRQLGADLLISAFGAAGAVERLSGRGAELWRLLGEGLTLAEAAAALSERTGAPLDKVESRVIEFADTLMAAQLASVVGES
jgi:hypothetical protein